MERGGLLDVNWSLGRRGGWREVAYLPVLQLFHTRIFSGPVKLRYSAAMLSHFRREKYYVHPVNGWNFRTHNCRSVSKYITVGLTTTMSTCISGSSFVTKKSPSVVFIVCACFMFPCLQTACTITEVPS